MLWPRVPWNKVFTTCRAVLPTVWHGDLLVSSSPCGDRVGPEALQWPVLRSLLLGFWCLRGAGIQHGLQDPPPCIYKPGDTKHRVVQFWLERVFRPDRLWWKHLHLKVFQAANLFNSQQRWERRKMFHSLATVVFNSGENDVTCSEYCWLNFWKQIQHHWDVFWWTTRSVFLVYSWWRMWHRRGRKTER